MFRWLWVVALLLPFTAPGAVRAAEKTKVSQPGVMLSVEKKSRSRTQYYIVNTPVGVEEPYFEAEIDSAGFVYTVDYDPRTRDEVLPDGCSAGLAVKVRIDHRHLFLRCLNSDSELKWDIQKKKLSAPDSENSKTN